MYVQDALGMCVGVIPLVSDLLSALWDGWWGWIHSHEAHAGVGTGVRMWSWLPRWVVEAMSVLCSTNVCAVKDPLCFLLSFYSSSQHLPIPSLSSLFAPPRVQVRPACPIPVLGSFPKSQHPWFSLMRCGDFHPPGLCGLQVSSSWSVG